MENVLNLRMLKYFDLYNIENDIKNFLIENYNKGNRCVKIITGRGINSKNNKAVIKPYVYKLLSNIDIVKRINTDNYGGCYVVWM